MARSLNRVQLIGNLTRDPELRYTPSGTAVCSFSIATNRSWTTDTGEKRDEADFHRIVAWNKLAELCSQFLVKGRKVYVEGRLQTRSWAAQDGTQKQTTEIVINDMILLDSKRTGEQEVVAAEDESTEPSSAKASEGQGKKQSGKAKSEAAKKEEVEETDKEVQKSAEEDEIAPDDIPF
jgi:single-strand DNA-binding protein